MLWSSSWNAGDCQASKGADRCSNTEAATERAAILKFLVLINKMHTIPTPSVCVVCMCVDVCVPVCVACVCVCVCVCGVYVCVDVCWKLLSNSYVWSSF